MRLPHKPFLLASILAGCFALSAAQAAPPPAWAWSAGKQTTDGQIQLKSLDGGTTRTVGQNLTGANAKVNQSAATQAPMVVIQATATLPIKTEGGAGTATTTGVAPNQAMGEGQAISADRQALLTYQGGVWSSARAEATLTLTSTVTENTACSPNGKVAKDTTGLLLSCQSSIWKKASGSGGVTGVGIVGISRYGSGVSTCNATGTASCSGVTSVTCSAGHSLLAAEVPPTAYMYDGYAMYLCL